VISSDEGREAVDRILNDAKKVVWQMLDQHQHIVEGLRDALLDRDELIGEEIIAVIEAAIAANVIEPAPLAVDAIDAVGLTEA